MADGVCVEMLPNGLLSLARFAFQAGLIDRSSISPFRINNLQHWPNDDRGDCDTSSDLARSLTVVSSIGASTPVIINAVLECGSC